MEVKVGQVWRFEDGIYEISEIKDCNVIIKWISSGKIKSVGYTIGQLKNYAELVTLDNIKPGEWVESIVNVPDGNDTRKGTKLKVSWEEGQNIQFYNRTGSYYKPHFKPCLPPVEENVTEPKTYTNSQIMDMMERGYFVEGDKIHTGNTIPPLVFSTDEDGYSSFVMHQDHMKNGCFAKGDRWTLDLVDRWEKVTLDEAVDEIAYGGVVKVVLKNGEYGTVQSESDWNDAVNFHDMRYGTWYKKVNRNDD